MIPRGLAPDFTGQPFTTSSSASFSMGGSVFPRFAALRRIPSQAVLLKEHFSGALASKIEDYVDTISSLGHAPVFRSLNAPCEGVMIAQDFSGVQPFSLRRLRDRNGIIAQGDTAFEDGSEVSAFVAGKETGHVLEDYEFRVSSMGCFPHFFYDADSFKEQAASLAFVNPCLFAGHALILTIMDDDALGNIAVVVFDLDVVNGVPYERLYAAHPIPVLAF